MVDFALPNKVAIWSWVSQTDSSSSRTSILMLPSGFWYIEYSGVKFAPESLAQFAPDLVAQFDRNIQNSFQNCIFTQHSHLLIISPKQHPVVNSFQNCIFTQHSHLLCN